MESHSYKMWNPPLVIFYKNSHSMPTANFIITFLEIVFFTSTFFLFSITATAQYSTTKKIKRNLHVEPYSMVPHLKEETGVVTLANTELEADPGYIFRNFRIGAVLYFEMAKDKWAFSSDLMYMNLDEDIIRGLVINSDNVDLKNVYGS